MTHQPALKATYLVVVFLACAPERQAYLDYSGRNTTPDRDEAFEYDDDFAAAQADANALHAHDDVTRAYVTRAYVPAV